MNKIPCFKNKKKDANQFKAKNDVVYAMQRCVGRWEPGRVQQAQLTVEALFCLQSIVVFNKKIYRDVAIALWWFAVQSSFHWSVSVMVLWKQGTRKKKSNMAYTCSG